jgi:SIR2-like domain
VPNTSASIRVPEELLKAAKEQNIILFIGAGFSKNISSQLPTGSQLVAKIAAMIDIDNRLLQAHVGNDYQVLAEYLHTRGDYQQVIQQLQNEMNSTNFSVKNSRPHLLLTQLKTEYIFTTNWDHWIEQAFRHENCAVNVVRTPADLLLKNQTKDSKYPAVTRRLVKFHGDFSDPKSLVFGVGTYFDRIIDESPFDLVLGHELLSKSVLFLGYSFSDVNLRIIWYKMMRQWKKLTSHGGQNKVPNSYIFSPWENPISEAWLNGIGIETISADSNPNLFVGSLVTLLEELLEAQNNE